MEVLTMVGGAVLAPLFESLIADLRSGHVLNYARRKGVLKEVCKWEETLKTIKAVLENAEEQQRTDESVKMWFNDLQNLAYDVEDILDEFNTKAKLESKAGTSKVRKVIRSSIASLTFVGTAELKDITERLESIRWRMEFLKLGAIGSKIGVKQIGKTSLTSCEPEVNEAYVYGREVDCQNIVEQLKIDGKMRVIPIVGMGGLGKTTLAQLVYNDASLQFDFKAWVTVGESFDVLNITKAILRQFGGDLAEDLSPLQAKLKEKLSGKKSLVVLDDVWITNEEYQLWTLFCSPFKVGTSESRIIVTTRSQSVSKITSTTDGYNLKGLSSDDCLSILANHALEREDFNEHPHLEVLGRQIAKKCDGLPLAAKALGGILRGKQDTSSWEAIWNSKIWEEGKSVLEVLLLSYHHLPSHLKRCFCYTAIFPKNYEFDKTRLVPLWMAEGFVQEMNDGYKCFDELLARSFFQKSSSDDSFYVMHHLVNDLARSISGNFCFNLDEEVENLCAKVRYSAFTCREYDVASRFERFYEMKHLRTFLPLKRSDQLNWERDYISCTVLDVIIKKLKYLRVLALPYAIRELPASIDCLEHLRCLDLSYAQMEMLPESLCKLFNLKALILFKCEELCKLPKGFCNLINLQFLDIRGTDSLEELPLRIGELKKLHILSKIVVGKTNGAGMLELLKIPNLHIRQHISGLQKAVNVEDVESWKMRQKEGIDGLTLKWSNKFDDSRNKKNEEEILSALKPQKNIKKLSIKSYGGQEFSSWIGDPWFFKMKILRLENCYNVASLPALGQLPSLEELTIEGMKGIKEVGMTFYGNVLSSAKVFPSLKILRIKDLEELYEWSNYRIDKGRRKVFPSLKKLVVENCPKLEVCSFTFPNLDEFVVDGCKEAVLRSISNVQCLTKLEIRRISGLESFSGAFLEALGSLQEMAVSSCDELKHLCEDEFNEGRLGCLKELHISDCKEVVSLVEEDEGNFFPPNLQHLSVFSCQKLEKLPNHLQNLTYLTVRGCPKLKTIPTRGLPHSMKHMTVHYCDSLVSVPEGIFVDNTNSGQMCEIEELTIKECNALILPSNLGFPASLRDLHISGSVVAQLFKSLQLQNGLSHLTSLKLQNCSNLESFPDTTPPIPTLLCLSLRVCENLRSFPNHMNQFTSLETLEMYDCQQLASFPAGGLPTSLKVLAMAYCDKLESKLMLEQSLNALTRLENLVIEFGGGMDDVNSFPHDSLLLPASLTYLSIRGFQNLKSITDGIQKLTTLEELSILECPRLHSLPRLGLPPSLGRLLIHECPILKKQCRKERGKFWPLVASIPAPWPPDLFSIRMVPERLQK